MHSLYSPLIPSATATRSIDIDPIRKFANDGGFEGCWGAYMDWKKVLSIPYRIVAKRAVRSSSILNPNLGAFGNWQPRLFLFVLEEIRRTVERLGNVCVVRHRVFLDDVGASYLARQPMADFEDMKPFVLKNVLLRMTRSQRMEILGFCCSILCLNDLGSNRNLLFDRLPLRGCRMPTNG
jgi:hypothetical protein